MFASMKDIFCLVAVNLVLFQCSVQGAQQTQQAASKNGQYDYGVYYPFPGDQMAQESSNKPVRSAPSANKVGPDHPSKNGPPPPGSPVSPGDSKSQGSVLHSKLGPDGKVHHRSDLVSVAGYGNEADLQLGLAFTIPFLSLPIKKLLSGFGFGGLGGFGYGGGYGGGYAGDGIGGGNGGYGYGGPGGFGGGDLAQNFKFNFAGVGIAMVVAVAAILLVPKIIHYLTGLNTSPYGLGYGRSLDGTPSDSIVSNVMARVDDALSDFHINSTSCVQRAVCSYIKSSVEKSASGKAGSVEKIIDGIVSNSMVNYVLSGTSIAEALEVGKLGNNCAAKYNQCNVTTSGMYKLITSFITDNKV